MSQTFFVECFVKIAKRRLWQMRSRLPRYKTSGDLPEAGQWRCLAWFDAFPLCQSSYLPADFGVATPGSPKSKPGIDRREELVQLIAFERKSNLNSMFYCAKKA